MATADGSESLYLVAFEPYSDATATRVKAYMCLAQRPVPMFNFIKLKGHNRPVVLAVVAHIHYNIGYH